MQKRTKLDGVFIKAGSIIPYIIFKEYIIAKQSYIFNLVYRYAELLEVTCYCVELVDMSISS